MYIVDLTFVLWHILTGVRGIPVSPTPVLPTPVLPTPISPTPVLPTLKC